MILRILLIIIVPILSIICSLMSSGIENIITAENKNWTTIPIFYWLVLWTIFWFSLYKFKFGTTKKLKMTLFRWFVILRSKYLLVTITKADELNDVQKKSIETWYSLLRDKKSHLSTCVFTNRRMVVNSDVTCIISPSNESNLMFIRSGNRSAYYDVWLPNSTISEMFNSFDKEQKVRFQRIIDDSRKTMSSVIEMN